MGVGASDVQADAQNELALRLARGQSPLKAASRQARARDDGQMPRTSSTWIVRLARQQSALVRAPSREARVMRWQMPRTSSMLNSMTLTETQHSPESQVVVIAVGGPLLRSFADESKTSKGTQGSSVQLSTCIGSMCVAG